MFAVTVAFQIKDDKVASFMPLLRENATISLNVEEGCLVFDVCTDPDRPSEVFLYELYEDAGAFDEHLASAHYRDFDARTAGMVVDKSVKTFRDIRR